MATAQKMAHDFRMNGWTKGEVLMAAEDHREQAAHWNAKGNEFMAFSEKAATIAFRKQDDAQAMATALREAARLM